MQQKLVYLHTDKNLKETEEILKQQGMEIILMTDTLYLNFSDMTEEEQLSYLKTLEADFEDTADELEIQDKEIEIIGRKGYSFSKRFREIINSLKNSRNTDTIKNYQHLQEELQKMRLLSHTLSNLGQRARTLHLNEKIHCACLIAKMETDVIRYLAFKNDPVLTITGPNATTLKSTLESKF